MYILLYFYLYKNVPNKIIVKILHSKLLYIIIKLLSNLRVVNPDQFI